VTKQRVFALILAFGDAGIPVGIYTVHDLLIPI